MSFNLRRLSLTSAAIALLINLPAAADSYNYQEEFFNQSAKPNLSRQDQENLKKLNNWSGSRTRSMQQGFVRADGTMIFTHGAQTPTVICAVLQLTDVELDKGEIINSVNIGDASRWVVEPAVTGSGSDAVQHVLIKPLDTGLNTTMMIATDQRAYRLELKSVHDQNFMQHVAFTYPEKVNAAFAAQQEKLQRERERNSIETVPDEPKTYLGDLNFNYKISGDVSWKPVRVFDDGKKTIIEMPHTMLAQKAPSLILLLKEGGLFTDEQTEIINYRLQGTRYVVDGIFDRALLTMGIDDDDEQRVIIERER